MKDNKFYKLHIFSPGDHRSASGHRVKMSPDDLKRTAEVFVSNHRVPLCIGHSSFKHHDVVPSLGWFRDVKQDDNGELYGLVEATTAGKNLLEGGYYENFSASFYSPDSPLNPKPGTWTLRHVAALGGEPPALKELDPMLEVLPEDFSEVQNFDTWYEFKEVDSDDYVSFSDGTKLLPDTYDFKSFRKYGKRLRCKNGWKQCGGRCIPPDQVCGGKDKNKAKKFTPGTRKDYKKPETVKKTATTDKKSKFVSKEEFKKQKQAETLQKKDSQVNKNLTKGTLKGLAATGLALAATYGGEAAFPDNKTAQSAITLLGDVAAKQFVVADDATISDRLQMAAVSGLQGAVEIAVKDQLQGNAYAGTMAKASSGIISTVLVDSGLIDLKYDKYAMKFHNATGTLASAVKETSEWKSENKRQENKFQQDIDALRKEVAEKTTPLSEDAIAGSMQRTYKRAAAAEESARRAASSAERQRRDFAKLLEDIVNGADPAAAAKKASQVAEALEDFDPNREFAEGDLTYKNSNVKITFTRGEIFGLILPLALSVLRYIGAYNSKDQGKALSRSVKSGNPVLEAVFSELDKTKGILKHDVSNDELAKALFGDDRLTDFSEDSKESMGRRRRKRRGKSSDFQEDVRPRGKKVLAIDAILDDALAQAESFAEERPVKKSASHKGKKRGKKRRVARPWSSQGRNFSEETNRQSHSPKAMDFAESAEYQRLTTEVAKLEREKRQIQVENFAEGLYEDGKITEGIVKKREFVSFLMGLEDNKNSFDFGEGSTANAYGIMENLLNNLEPLVSFSEVVTGKDAIIPQPKFEDGYDMASQKLDYQINLLMQADPKLTYEQAWVKVAGRSL